MSTRGLLVYKEGDTVVSYYLASDAYPTYTLELIQEHLHQSNAENFIVGEQTLSGIKQNSDLEKEYEGNSDFPTDWGGVGNSEWVYVVDLNKKNIDIHGATWGKPQLIIAEGKTDPLTYVARIRTAYQDSEKRRIQNNLDNLIKLGFTFNN